MYLAQIEKSICNICKSGRVARQEQHPRFAHAKLDIESKGPPQTSRQSATRLRIRRGL